MEWRHLPPQNTLFPSVKTFHHSDFPVLLTSSRAAGTRPKESKHFDALGVHRRAVRAPPGLRAPSVSEAGPRSPDPIHMIAPQPLDFTLQYLLGPYKLLVCPLDLSNIRLCCIISAGFLTVTVAVNVMVALVSSFRPVPSWHNIHVSP